MPCVSSSPPRPEEGIEPLELKLHTVVCESLYGCWEQNLVLCESHKHPELWSHGPAPAFSVFNKFTNSYKPGGGLTLHRTDTSPRCTVTCPVKQFTLPWQAGLKFCCCARYKMASPACHSLCGALDLSDSRQEQETGPFTVFQWAT